MKWALFASISGLVAAAEGTNGILDPIARLGAVGVLGAALLFLITRTIPSMSKANREGMREISETLTALRIHCAKKQDE